MGKPIARTDLCDAAFLAALDRLRIVAKRVAPRGRFAEQRSADKGAGIEFKDYRPYVAGDDLRAIDWNVYRRLGRVFVRLFEELEDLPLYLLPDVSRSAFFETATEKPRVIAGLRAALGFAAVSLGQHDRVGVFPFADDLRVLVRPSGGKGRILSLAERVASLVESGPNRPTDIERSLATFQSLRLREGLVVLLSDFFDPRGLDVVTRAISRLRHRVLLVRLVRTSDAEPTLRGDLRLVDCESRLAADVSITDALLQRYRAAHQRFRDGLATFAVAHGFGLVELDVDRDVLPQLERLFAHGAFVA